VTTAAPDFISLQAVTYLDLAAGLHRFAVRSDDNFQVTAGPVTGDTNIILGIFDAGGRADAETTFDFLAEAAGLYAFRLVYEEGQGGASLEFYSIDPVTSVRTLINDAAVGSSVKAYRTRAGAPVCAPPQIAVAQPPTNPAFFHPAANGVSFTATAATGNTIAPADIHVTLNGTEISDTLTIGGTPGARTVSFGLTPNRVYTAAIVVTDNNGRSASTTLRFDTFVAGAVKVIEAEDYNYDSLNVFCDLASSGVGGGFDDNAVSPFYFGFRGVPNIDFSDTSALNPVFNSYRVCNEVGTQVTFDAPRPVFVTAGVSDYQVWKMQAGEWLNYTRTFPAGCYSAYLRVSSSTARQLRLDSVGGNPTTASQTTSSLGTFRVPNTGGPTFYQYVALTDTFGNPIALSLAGVQTLRLTSVDANDDVQPNFLVFAPAGSALPPTIVSISPAPGAVGVTVNAAVSINVVNGCTAVQSTRLFVDGNEVTADATITPGALGETISYLSPKFFQTGSVHTVKLLLLDNAVSPNTVSNQWTFSVTPYGLGAATNVNFAAGAGNSAGNPVAPVPAGYVQDIGDPYGNRGNGFSYGWDRNIVADGRYRQAVNSPDLRYDTFMHMIKATPPAIWEIAVPNGPYQFHVVGGDPANLDSVIQYDIEGTITGAYTPAAPNNWGEFTGTCTVTDGRLTVKSGPSSQTTANNNKICFIDITPLNVAIAPTVSRQPQSQSVSCGSSVSFVVCIRGTGPLNYQWFKGATAITGATNDTLTLNNVQSSDAGSYHASVSNSANSTTSLDATLTVTDPIAATLSIALAGPNVIISWPISCTTYSLEGTPVLPAVTWSPVAPPAAIVPGAGSYHATIPIGGSNTFFRLRFP
jgi:hypothetical protein